MSVKWTMELLEECRNEKGVVLGMMSNEAREAIKENGESNHIELFENTGQWERKEYCGTFIYAAYRLSPDWTPDELREKEYVDIPLGYGGGLISNGFFSHVFAQSKPDFICYVYADGKLSTFPRRGDLTGPAEIPVAVRFAKQA